MSLKLTGASVAVVIVALAATPVLAQQATNPNAAQGTARGNASPDAANFVATATASNNFEIQSSKAVEGKARSADVKEFARMMIADHTKAGTEMMEVAKKANLTVPGDTTTLDPPHKQMLDSITSASDMDKAYVQAQLQAHQEAVALFRAYSSNGDNPALKQFASKTLPTLEKHLREVEKLSKSVKS